MSRRPLDMTWDISLVLTRHPFSNGAERTNWLCWVRACMANEQNGLLMCILIKCILCRLWNDDWLYRLRTLHFAFIILIFFRFSLSFLPYFLLVSFLCTRRKCFTFKSNMEGTDSCAPCMTRNGDTPKERHYVSFSIGVKSFFWFTVPCRERERERKRCAI